MPQTSSAPSTVASSAPEPCALAPSAASPSSTVPNITVPRLHTSRPGRTRINFERWPAAVRSAELAHGTLVRCGPGVRLAAWPDTPATRAHVLRELLGTKLIPILISAAWVWGCAGEPGSPISCSTRGGGRPKLACARTMRVHEFHYAATDLVACDGVALPTPERTVCDLLRLEETFTVSLAVTCRLLVQRGQLSRERCQAALHAGPGRHRARALTRLAALL
ncbi:hypothetical protein JOF28_000346 [Leucobacter exalbidus]|uniref:AbiEi antitoxin C-terminal domain-containing protein n=1 Tax=Leucobacter exalbidus TaxID=662960 RepID=A0A940PPB2_9MICO|nr:hypothetical protein [Leucobacter exalbidus]MBP1325114.1 hypothetical protein [Leucobacter exalbidus]